MLTDRHSLFPYTFQDQLRQAAAAACNARLAAGADSEAYQRTVRAHIHKIDKIHEQLKLQFPSKFQQP